MGSSVSKEELEEEINQRLEKELEQEIRKEVEKLSLSEEDKTKLFKEALVIGKEDLKLKMKNIL